MNVLVVSESPTVRTLASVALDVTGFNKVTFAADRAEALVTLSAGWPDALILDWRLPAASVVAAAARNSGVAFMTVNDEGRIAERGGAFACLPSPFTARSIADILLSGVPARA